MDTGRKSQEAKFNILRGLVICSLLDNEDREEMLDFINQLESDATAE